MIKEKKCKGQGIALGFGCGKMTKVENRIYGLGKDCGCYSHWLLNTEAGKNKIQKSILKTQKQKLDKKTAVINTTDLNKKLQTKINQIVRFIDYGLPCLAKGKHAKQIHAGHVYSRGSNPMLRFNLHNIHRQSAQSNHFQNEDGVFREGIIKEYGINYYEFISNLRQIKDLKITTDIYIELYKKASKIAIKLSKNQNTYSIQERIRLRNDINLELKIYDEKYCYYETNG